MDLDTLFKLLEKNPGLSITFESLGVMDDAIIKVSARKYHRHRGTIKRSMAIPNNMSDMSPGFRDAYILETIKSVLEENKGEQEGEWL